MSSVREQIEKILDEGEGKHRNIIVQMKGGRSPNDAVINRAIEVYRRRNLTLSARELLPAPKEKLSRAATRRPTAAMKRDYPSNLSMYMGMMAANGRVSLQREGKEALEPLMKNSMTHKAIERTLKARASATDLPLFWTSKSAVMDMAVDDLRRLQAEVPEVQGVYPNRMLRLPPLVEATRLPLEIQDERASSWGINRIGALAVWGAYGVRGKGVRVAVLDTGVDADHPDLKGKVTAWAEFDRDGRQVPDSSPYDSEGHGTHCAGTIVGGNASGRWIGVAPEAEIAAALVLQEGVGSDAQVLAGIDWAIEQQVDIISMSLGGLSLDVEPPDPYTQALYTAASVGIPVITAIGNDGSQITGTPGNDFLAFSVGATDYRDRTAGFSGGRTHVIRTSHYIERSYLPFVYSKPEVSAPGVAIYSAMPDGEWKALNGTSMAAPHVAGAMALLLSGTSIKTDVSQEQRAALLQELIISTVEELGEAGQDHRYGFGRLDVLRALGMAKELGY